MFSLKTGENDSFFYYTSNFLEESLKNELEKFLETSKFHGGKCLSGKEIPRRQLWFQRQNGYFCNLWKYKYPRWESNEYSEVLDKIEKYTQTKINEILAKNNITPPNLNSILINKYRDGADSIRPHRDSPISFGETPIIIVISIGASRDLLFKKVKYNNNIDSSNKIDNKNPQEFAFKMENNSLFIMGGGSQRYFTHEIPKCDCKNTRYSLTLREYLEH